MQFAGATGRTWAPLSQVGYRTGGVISPAPMSGRLHDLDRNDPRERRASDSDTDRGDARRRAAALP
jgi:hypothetical protein